MKRYGIAVFAATAAMMIGGSLAAVSNGPVSGKSLAAMNDDVMNPMIAGQAMLPSRDLLENISASAMKDSGVADALKAQGQLTVFAPTNAALASLSAQTLTHDKSQLARQMSYLLVPGRYDSQALLKAIGEGGGSAKLRTAEGGVLVARMNGPTNIILVDEGGNTANISIYDVYDKNGVMHVVDHILQPGASARQVATE
jgi:uncharacterized surface protein with fasciclin (FAS1) repeats